MYEVRQQVAQGDKHALNHYKVYQWQGEERVYLGWFKRGNRAKFNPYREYTDTQKKAILNAINGYLQGNGYPLIERYGQHGRTQAEVQELLERAGLAREASDE